MTASLRVDSHVHLYPSAEIGMREKQAEIWEYGGASNHASSAIGIVDELVQQMDRVGISRCILLIYTYARDNRERAIAALPSNLGKSARQDRIAEIDATVLSELEWNNLWGCRLPTEYPQINTFVTADLSVQTGEMAADHVVDLVEKHGARGVKFHTGLQKFSMSDERLWPLYSACEQRGIPVLGHGGPDREGRGYCDPRAFAPMLKAFPKLTVVMAHMGGATWRQTLEVAREFPNLCFDCSEIIEWTNSPNGPTVEELAGLIKGVGSHRVMMGSDFPWYDLDTTVENIARLPLLNEQEKEAIIGLNALNLLRL